MKSTRIVLLLFGLACLIPGQTNRGGIAGTVSDPAGAAIAGAAIIATNLGTNQEFRATTSESGAYSILSVDPVTYKISIEAPGFKRTVIQSTPAASPPPM